MSMRTLFAALILAISGPAVAGDVQRGLEIGYTCMGCHGIEGQRNAFPSFRVPRLGGQHPEYIVTALQGYRNGTRLHPTMQAQAASLSDQDMSDLAAYFASLGELRTGRPGRAAARTPERAEVCASCHGQDGVSISPAYPTIAGQHRDYLVWSLKGYRDGRRTDPVMAVYALDLTDRDIQNLARYYAAHPGLFTPRR